MGCQGENNGKHLEWDNTCQHFTVQMENHPEKSMFDNCIEVTAPWPRRSSNSTSDN